MIELSSTSPVILMDDPLHIIEKHNIILKYHQIQYGNSVFYLGICNRISNFQCQQELFNLVFYQSNYWHNVEKARISKFIEKLQYDRLWEWALSKILIKEGVKLFFNQDKKKELNKIFVDFTSKSKLKIFYQEEEFLEPTVLKNVSISHSSKQIFSVIASIDIGIDSESVKLFSPILKSKIVSEEEEFNLLRSFQNYFDLSPSDLPSLIWVIKESTFKAIGISNIAEIHNIAVYFIDGRIITCHNSSNQKYINFFTVNNQFVFVISFPEKKKKD